MNDKYSEQRHCTARGSGDKSTPPIQMTGEALTFPREKLAAHAQKFLEGQGDPTLSSLPSPSTSSHLRFHI